MLVSGRVREVQSRTAKEKEPREGGAKVNMRSKRR
jgi:hypothetical protein